MEKQRLEQEGFPNMTSHKTSYQITIRGHLDPRWESWFEMLTISPAYGEDGAAVTRLNGSDLDQAALYGILTRLRNLGAELVSVEPLPDEGGAL